MTGISRVLVGLAARFSPRSCRAERAEQWLADIRDAPELGISPLSIARGALRTTLTSKGRSHVDSKEKPVNQSGRPIAAVAKITLGAFAFSLLLSGGLSLGTGWLADRVQFGIRSMSVGADGGKLTWGSLDDEAPPEKVDVSTLTVVGRIDPSTGNVVDITPYHPDQPLAPAN